MTPLTEDHLDFLAHHSLAVLATGRRDGSPQMSTVVYALDGTDVIVSAKAYTAKWKNARRQPNVALAVLDGRRQLVLYGTAALIDADPERAQLTAKVWEAMTGEPVDPTSLIPHLDEQQRTVLRIPASKVLMND